MTEPDNQNEIIEKIRKLMALAERGGTEAEGDAAMRKVQEMLTRYNLDIDAIKDKTEVSFVRDFKEFEWNASWIKVVAYGIAKLYFCHMYNEPRGQECLRIAIIGKPVNVETVKCILDAVVSTGKKLAKLYAQNAYKEFGMNPVSASNGFKKGYGIRIQQRCLEMVRDAQTPKSTESGQALVVADYYKRNRQEIDLYEKNVLGLRLQRGSGMASGDAGHMGAGSSAANNVSLSANGIGTRGATQAFRLGSN